MRRSGSGGKLAVDNGRRERVGIRESELKRSFGAPAHAAAIAPDHIRAAATPFAAPDGTPGATPPHHRHRHRARDAIHDARGRGGMSP